MDPVIQTLFSRREHFLSALHNFDPVHDHYRTGYHDTHDTMENIDLDYGAAVSANAIETMVRMAAS